MNQLDALLDRLKEAQHLLIDDAARADMMPSDGVIRKIAELENAIAAVVALMHERDPSLAGG
jgi:hypothetical protein